MHIISPPYFKVDNQCKNMGFRSYFLLVVNEGDLKSLNDAFTRMLEAVEPQIRSIAINLIGTDG